MEPELTNVQLTKHINSVYDMIAMLHKRLNSVEGHNNQLVIMLDTVLRENRALQQACSEALSYGVTPN